MACRVQYVAEAEERLRRSLPDAAYQEMGLHQMGAVVGDSWTDDEAACFEEGLFTYGKDYKAICRELLPHREPKDLGLFYYNVGKTQATPRAQAWYQKRQVTTVCASLAQGGLFADKACD